MEDRWDGLWQGGSWERPDQAAPPPAVVRIPKRRQEKQRRKPRWRRWAAFLGMIVLILGVTAALGLATRDWRTQAPREEDWPYYYRDQEEPDMEEQPPQLPRAATGTGVTLEFAPASEERLTLSQIYEENQRSIVTIYAVSDWGVTQGTGIVFDRAGYIVTNAHIIAGARRASVVMSNDVEYEASLVSYDTDEDLAVLRVETDELVPARFGDSLRMKVGEDVCALGTPMGYNMTLTEGVISAVDRELTVEGTTMHLLQTSTPINFGNSGGALFNDQGQVVGITTVKIVGNDGSVEALGFAIPSERVKYVVDHLIAGEEIVSPILGISVIYHPGSSEGLEVTDIEPWSDAGTKGMQVGDRITAVNGRAVEVFRDLERVKDLHRVGDELELGVTRDGEQLRFSVRLEDPAMRES